MKKLLTLLLLAVGMTAAAGTMKTITVDNEADFLRALGGNRVIKIADNTRLNLSTILEYEDLCLDVQIPFVDYGEIPTGIKEMLFSENRFDGRQLTMKNIANLTIVGGEGCEIVVEPRYANVLNFLNCKNITLRNLTVGHTDEGYCEGGVIFLENCENVKIDGCDLYGCGTMGIESYNTHELRCVRTTIRDCSYGIMTLVNTNNAFFIDSRFVRCREFGLVEIRGEQSYNIDFRRCYFADNQGQLFALGARIGMEKCEIHHPEANLGTTEFIMDKDCTWEE